ncbi:MAG TPA: hypothetical protein VJV79_07525 [Polyangiaceae bacterium]|nr:hypothetical protein [Polyangiaceae bacterium]
MLLGRWLVGGILALTFGCSSADDAQTNANAAVLHVCSPLEPTSSTVTLEAGSILAAGRSADGTVYVVTQTNSKLRLFVSDREAEREAIVEQPAAGTGEEPTGASTTWLLDYVDAEGTAVSVKIEQDDTGLRIGVLKGPKAGKSWDLQQGELLTALNAAEAAALPATSTPCFVVGTQSRHPPDRTIGTVAPDQG